MGSKSEATHGQLNNFSNVNLGRAKNTLA